ncbi:probable cytosolic Fe-S cluster assembly factor AAEL012261 [Diachasma alloeum]|uniref:probable cytosolic Fe-S cluster assembly factor AAEL012261 n=1 Tax=Diachasma alloeum TaxID=454923 RepID=UPI0007381244|nr:probable cytosolic Fe-S cluster assembly factor AAEL012261 [Diachasma alloeum]XP_015110182.1 probable cytosolic Fe-S cluster assembly factor AAEL012261 [Diachasma alloeum]XP_015110183.1 probable cytosolic Fe-S cluster assembly factor AAEL012261 [Diachasma alloeum]XP_015110184.1 probable cytosolic Fe-S cluster assembly factor AAEL012261 [Diachasma alloeum]XP_015110185.1 probable cytosolic Fe-S cluster assembly factor AAEL012261 [Diachasma alloeum]XP_028981822.1 probable cytosolic Fe-S cluste
MASRFSGALQITSLDDFITPSQECIKPIEVLKSTSKTGSKIKIQDDGAYVQLNERGSEKLQKVEITLADCLACSGCITTAESVLVTQQSQEELLRVFQENQALKSQNKTPKLIVVSLSVQPVLSLAQKYDLDPGETTRRLSGYFKSLGADLVLEMSTAEDFALLESAKEFTERFKTHQEGSKGQIPMLASSCPGWVCYAEKTHGNFILPFISVTKSPQQIMGSLVKNYLAERWCLSPERIYHITLMPCYDKKLEASREDFYNKAKETRDVDCVITSIELEQMLENQGKSLTEVDPAPLDRPFTTDEQSEVDLWSHRGSGSGGYADFIFEYAAKHLFQISDSRLDLKSLRNPDFQEGVLERNGEVLLRFGVANGFRNIQNLVQKLKRNKCTYHYVEVMACPAGCLNGGAQIRPQDGSQPRELAQRLEKNYHDLPESKPENNKVVQNLYKSWLGSGHTDKASAFLHTQYHEIEKMSSALAMKW